MITDVGNQELIKKINRRLVLKKIKDSGTISRVQIARELNLSKSTVSSIVDGLIEKQVIIETGEAVPPKGGGRPARMLIYNPQSKYGIGIDIGGTKILIVITDLAGKIVLKKKLPTTNKVEEIVKETRESIAHVNLKEHDIIGMGVGVPGTVDNDGMVIRAKSLSWFNLRLKDILEKEFPFPVVVGNDVNMAACGEQWLGSGAKSDDMFFISIGTGIGSAIISNGRIIDGYQFRAGEACYLTDVEDIRNKQFNVLGEPGTLERKISGDALGACGRSAEALFAAYSQGEPEAVGIIKNFILYLSVTIANVISLLNPERVVMGGGVSDSLPLVLYEIRDTVNMLTPIKADICLSSLGNQAGALGAIATAITHVEEN